MYVSPEGLVSGSVNRAELAEAYKAATSEAARANLAAVGVAHGMVARGGRLVDPSTRTAAPRPEPAPEPEAEAESVKPAGRKPPAKAPAKE